MRISDWSSDVCSSDLRMGAFIMRLLNVDAAHARRVQKQYFHAHGTTMAGLMRHHGVHPEDFLLDVHNIALDRLTVDTRLRARSEERRVGKEVSVRVDLGGRRIIKKKKKNKKRN